MEVGCELLVRLPVTKVVVLPKPKDGVCRAGNAPLTGKDPKLLSDRGELIEPSRMELTKALDSLKDPRMVGIWRIRPIVEILDPLVNGCAKIDRSIGRLLPLEQHLVLRLTELFGLLVGPKVRVKLLFEPTDKAGDRRECLHRLTGRRIKIDVRVRLLVEPKVWILEIL